MALVNVGSDPWMLEYQSCENLSREIMEQLHTRNKERPGTMPYDLISGKTRVWLRQLGNEISQLRDKLQLPSVVSHLTDDEKNRRLQQVEKLQARLMQLQDLHVNGQKSLPGSTSRSVVVDIGTTGWVEDEDDPIKQVIDVQKTQPIEQIRASHADMFQAQEQGLAELSQVISRQKRIAGVISNELDDQNEILDDIANNMDTVDLRVQRETQSVRVIGRKVGTCGYWVVILLLFIAIVAVGFS